MRHILAPTLILALLFGGCSTIKQTPEAITYDTLQQASNVIVAKHALFEVAVAEGKVSLENERNVRKAYIAANRSIAAASRAMGGALDVSTPEATAALVDAFIDLVTQIVPPKSN